MRPNPRRASIASLKPGGMAEAIMGLPGFGGALESAPPALAAANAVPVGSGAQDRASPNGMGLASLGLDIGIL